MAMPQGKVEPPSYGSTNSRIEPDSFSDNKKITPLNSLTPNVEWIQCPNCGKVAQTRVEARSAAAKKAMKILFWPMPDREHYWEKIHWFCTNCDKELAFQKQALNEEVHVLV